jgi:hypothetical protein
MPELADLLDGDFDVLTYADVERIVASLPDETHVVELKREWPSGRDLAHDCCSFANGFGGVVLVGYEDPKHGKKPFPGVDGSSAKMDALMSSIQSLTSPAVHCYMRSFEGPNGHVVVAISVPRTENGPHEYIGGDKPNLPVRRGKSNKSLSLSEIVALQRRTSMRPALPLEDGYPIISINMLSGTFWGVEFQPEEWPETPFVFHHDDDLAVQNLWRSYDWKPVPKLWLNGIELAVAEAEPSIGAAVQTNGMVAVKWSTAHRQWMWFVGMLEQAYDFASMVFHHLKIAPRAVMYVRWGVKEEDAEQRFPFPPSGQLSLRVDFSRTKVADVLSFFSEQADRSAGRSRPMKQVEDEIGRAIGPTAKDPRVRWGLVS